MQIQLSQSEKELQEQDFMRETPTEPRRDKSWASTFLKAA